MQILCDIMIGMAVHGLIQREDCCVVLELFYACSIAALLRGLLVYRKQATCWHCRGGYAPADIALTVWKGLHQLTSTMLLPASRACSSNDHVTTLCRSVLLLCDARL